MIVKAGTNLLSDPVGVAVSVSRTPTGPGEYSQILD